MIGVEPQPPCGNTGVNSPQVVEAWTGVDWLTGFVSKDWGCDIWFDFNLLNDLAQGQHGARERPWAKQGFSGRARGQVAAGEREDGTLREVTGAMAHLYTERVGESYHLVRPSRLDIAFTFRLERYQPELARSYYSTESLSPGAPCRPRQRRFFSSQQGGDTLYIGSTSSDGMLRLYDKQQEQKGKQEYERCWRLEFQLRRAQARVCWSTIHGSEDTGRAIRGILKAQCEREGILGFVDWDTDAIRLGAIDRPAQYLEKRLEWLSTQVAPTVRELREEGYGPAVLEALGLDGL